LDGGGIRGIITCIILRYIEEQLQFLIIPLQSLAIISTLLREAAQED
jgi:patatin-like phospholipase/acyl hydrolase